jgi:hypothetical protein
MSEHIRRLLERALSEIEEAAEPTGDPHYRPGLRSIEQALAALDSQGEVVAEGWLTQREDGALLVTKERQVPIPYTRYVRIVGVGKKEDSVIQGGIS